MRAVVVYESMYGNTHLIADAVGEGLRRHADEVLVVSVQRADRDLLANADVLVVGGPTHGHGLSHANTRRAAVDAAHQPGSELEVDPDAEGQGLREWFAGLDRIAAPSAAFDTRFDMPAALTGRASRGIARKLRHHGAELVAEPESFLVTKDNHLLPEESQRARDWGAALSARLSRARPAATAPAER